MKRPEVAPLGSDPIDLDHGLAARGRGAPARAGHLVINGRRVAATGTGADGLASVVLAGRAVTAAGPAPVGAAAGSVLLTPLGWERRLSVDGRAVIERVVADHDAPIVFCEWETVDAAALLLRWVTLSAAPPAGFLFSHEPEADPGTGSAGLAPGESRVRFRLDRGERLRLAVAAGADADRAAATAAGAGDPAARVFARAAALGRAEAERLRVDAPARAVGAAIGWAAAVLDACAPDPDAALLTGLAALGLARFEAGAAMIGESVLGLSGVAAWTGRRTRAATDAGAGDPLRLPAGLIGSAPGGEAWVAFTAGDPDAAFDRWCADITTGPLPGRLPAVALDAGWAAAIALPFVYGLLGAAPDATLQRLRLRPRIPGAWDRLDADGLRVGDAAVALRYRREGGRHAFEIEQKTGAVPLTLLFEPALPGARLVAARVEGQAAALDTLPAGRRLIAPVQLVLDHARRVEYDVG